MFQRLRKWIRSLFAPEPTHEFDRLAAKILADIAASEKAREDAERNRTLADAQNDYLEHHRKAAIRQALFGNPPLPLDLENKIESMFKDQDKEGVHVLGPMCNDDAMELQKRWVGGQGEAVLSELRGASSRSTNSNASAEPTPTSSAK